MDVESAYRVENKDVVQGMKGALWPLDEIDPKNGKFPCCLVWTPLPVVSWLAPFIGHVGLCREDGAVIDFTGSGFINVNDFAYGAVAKYLQLDRDQCCFPSNLAGHSCIHRYKHAEFGTAISWDDTIHSGIRQFEHKSYNLFTCNSHSFIANCLNRMCYKGSMNWNMINVAALVLLKGRWVNLLSVVRAFFPFVFVACLGIFMVGWPFFVALFSFSFLILVWFVLGTYFFKNILED